MFDKSQPAYIDLRNIVAERTRSVVAWVGAGLSQPAGLPGWETLRGLLTGEAEQRVRQLDASDPAMDLQRGRLKAAKEQANPWIAFQILRDIVGLSSFRACIRRALQSADTCKVPLAYLSLWRIGAAGMLTLNLDRLATKSWNEVTNGKLISEFQGHRGGDNAHLLRSGKPFIANLHGIANEESSWIFTQDSLSDLLDDDGYKNFIRTVASSKTILFAGISADDISAGGHLESLRQLRIDFGSHYWLTHRADYKTFEWAERSGIQLITYDSRNGHAELDEIFADLESFVPVEAPAEPVALAVAARPETLGAPSELVTKPLETIRSVLNAAASNILRDRPEDYPAFYSKYDEAIYRAWYVGPSPAGQAVLGYTLDSEIARGAFGRVFKAHAPDGESVALKLLHEEVRHAPEKLDAFRRGVKAMQILSARGVRGMVPYKAASEIPAFAVMELINGPNLAEAAENGIIDTWQEILKIATAVASVVRTAHSLPERVLHRDIRPPNIMLKDYYANHEQWEVVLLDFDLSWHRDALGKSVAAETLHGYLAPEQVSEHASASTRNALVDSFGLGMTLYFLGTHKDPVFAQHLHADWESNLVASVSQREPPAWKSLPRRFARLIVQSTRNVQSLRVDIHRIEGELRMLQQAELDPSHIESAEILAEELMARSSIGAYSWDPDRTEATTNLASGLEVYVRGDEVEQEVTIRLTWRSTGTQERKQVSKWLPDAGTRAFSRLKKSGWAPDLSHESMGLTINATIGVTTLAAKLDALSLGLSAAAEELRFN